jgi:hypothetical protein
MRHNAYAKPKVLRPPVKPKAGYVAPKPDLYNGTMGPGVGWDKDWLTAHGYGPQAAASPAAPAAPKFDAYLDPGYAASAGAYTTQGEHAQAQHDYQTHRGAQSYGYDAQGNLISGGSDWNPYNEAQILQRNYDNTVRGTTNSYAAQGQLYSGAINNAQNTNTWNYGVASDKLKRGASDFYNSNDVTLQGVQDQGLQGLAQLLGPAFQAWLQSQKGY